MTVRRYSINSNLSGVTVRETGTDQAQLTDSGWGRLQEEIQHGNNLFGDSSRGDVGKVTNRHSLQEYVHKNRYKIRFGSQLTDIVYLKPCCSFCRYKTPVLSLTFLGLK